MNRTGFTWIDTHQKIADYLSDHRNDQPGIIQLLRDIEITALNDRDENDQIIDLTEIDPFTFFCYLYKHRQDKNLANLQRLSKLIGLSPEPSDINGIPSANAQKVWLFPYKKTRKNNEVARLWAFFDALRSNTITEELVITSYSIHYTKLYERNSNTFINSALPALPYSRKMPWVP